MTSFESKATQSDDLRQSRDSNRQRLSDRVIAICGVPDVTPLAQLHDAVADALRHPLDFPHFCAAGDRVTLPFQADVPRIPELADAIVCTLVEDGILAEDVTLLLPAEYRDRGDQWPIHQMAPPHRNKIQVVFHDPQDQPSLGYLAANQAGDPVYFHRTLSDADVVLPVRVAGSAQDGIAALHQQLFPSFSDANTIHRLEQQFLRDDESFLDAWAREAEFAEWSLGVLQSIEVVAGPGESILQVLTGKRDSVALAAQQAAQQAWQFSVPASVGMVVATLDDQPGPPSWSSIARSVLSANRLLHQQGSIVVCGRGPFASQADHQPAWPDEGEFRLQGLSATCPPAVRSVIENIRQETHLYLMSDLAAGEVESLGMVPIRSWEELTRLGLQYERCVVAHDAHRCEFPVNVSP